MPTNGTANGIRYQVQYQPPGKKAMRRDHVRDHSDAAHQAVNLATAGALSVVVMRFDPLTGWDLVGMARTVSGSVVYEDGRTPSQREQDTARPDTEDPPALPVRRGRRSGMRVFATYPRRAVQ